MGLQLWPRHRVGGLTHSPLRVNGRFMCMQRVYLDYSQLVVGVENTVVLERAIGDLARRFEMRWRLSYTGTLIRVAVLVRWC